ncbi:D-alanyl-D-alanine carboxypeptidase, partial [Eubacteriales bacterium OttesenSCG-928-K08]|nr:D-alanyl-D-alanine carboxypeptidase [Eubacteriales bacterium OttesenSCG-928-K08]
MKSLKKVICIFIALMLLLAAPAALAIAAPEDMSTKNVLLIEAETGTVLYEKNADMQAKPASTTKIMTCILALENGNLDDIVTVPSVTSSGSTMGIRRGEKMSLRSLIYGMMLVSGNDAAEAVAVHIGGTKDDFVKMMNEKAQSLGMTGTNFVAPSGLEKEKHYTTARDFARLAQYAMYESPQKNNFRIIVNTKTYTVKDSSSKVYELITTNRLLYTSETGKSANVEYKYAIGVKTGMTPASLECLVSAAEKNGVTLILVQFGEPDSDTRFKLAAELFEYGFENYVTRDASALNLASTVEVSVQNASMENGETGLLALNVQFENQPVNCLKADWDRMMNDSSAITSTIIPV